MACFWTIIIQGPEAEKFEDSGKTVIVNRVSYVKKVFYVLTGIETNSRG